MDQPTEPKKRICTHGINSLDDLRGRCYVDDITGCWHWRGSMRDGKYPSLWIPALALVVTMGTAIHFLTKGVPPPPQTVWRIKCRTEGCANPEHRTMSCRAVVMRKKMTKSPSTRAKLAEIKRAKSKLTEQDVAEIRASDATGVALAEQYGVSRSSISSIRRGRHWMPIAAHGSSVFNWSRA